jgi:hypothetical protein
MYIRLAVCISVAWASIAQVGCAGGEGGAAGTPGDASGPACGGFAGLRCPSPDTMFCDYADEAACGVGDATGVCTPRPDACTKDCPGACGCDGKSYCNACEANRAGTDVNPRGVCPAPAHLR